MPEIATYVTRETSCESARSGAASAILPALFGRAEAVDGAGLRLARCVRLETAPKPTVNDRLDCRSGAAPATSGLRYRRRKRGAVTITLRIRWGIEPFERNE